MKKLRINYCLLWEEEVPDNITEEECKEIVESHAEEFFVNGFYSDVEWQVDDKHHNWGKPVRFVVLNLWRANMKISWSHGAHVACFGKIFNDGWAQLSG